MRREIKFVSPITIKNRKGEFITFDRLGVAPSGQTFTQKVSFADECGCIKAARMAAEIAADKSLQIAPNPTCTECKGKGLVHARMTMTDYCELIANDAKFAKKGAAGNRAGTALVSGALDAEVNSKGSFFLTDSAYKIVVEILNDPSPESVLPSEVARCVSAFEQAILSARTIEDDA